MQVDVATPLTPTPVHYPPQVYCNAPAVVSTLRQNHTAELGVKETINYRERLVIYSSRVYFLFIDSSDGVFFNTASSIALVIWQMQRQFFKHLRVNSHLICISWVKGLDRSGWWKFKSEAEIKLINALCLTSTTTSHAQCQVSWIGDTFGFTHVFHVIHMCHANSEKIWQTDIPKMHLYLLFHDEVITHRDQQVLVEEANVFCICQGNSFPLLILPYCYNLKSKTAGQLEPTET